MLALWKMLILWHCVKVKQHYRKHFFTKGWCPSNVATRSSIIFNSDSMHSRWRLNHGITCNFSLIYAFSSPEYWTHFHFTIEYVVGTCFNISVFQKGHFFSHRRVNIFCWNFLWWNTLWLGWIISNFFLPHILEADLEANQKL